MSNVEKRLDSESKSVLLACCYPVFAFQSVVLYEAGSLYIRKLGQIFLFFRKQRRTGKKFSSKQKELIQDGFFSNSDTVTITIKDMERETTTKTEIWFLTLDGVDEKDFQKISFRSGSGLYQGTCSATGN